MGSYVTVSLSLFLSYTNFRVCVCFLSDLCPLYDHHYMLRTQSLESIVGRLVHQCIWCSVLVQLNAVSCALEC